MRNLVRHRWLSLLMPIASCLFPYAATQAIGQEIEPPIRWDMFTINDQSPFEACGAADFNGDGEIDIFCGDSWYESPKWTRHKVREVLPGTNPHYYEDFCDSPLDVNGDGRPDIVTCNYFGKRVGWVENPGGDATQSWTEHEIDVPGNMETGELVDINGDGRPDFLPNVGQSVVWYELTQQKPKVVWTKHDLGKSGAGHGVGAGDLNGDGKIDILTPKGWYEQPANASSTEWPFHAEFELGGAGIFIHGRDIDGDKLADVVYGMGHGFWSSLAPAIQVLRGEEAMEETGYRRDLLASAYIVVCQLGRKGRT